ncbi:MAG: GNAT family N-acetyltransferase [Chloroflexota bacterium]
MNELNVTHNQEKKRFETTVNDQTAFLEYIPAGENIVLSHTEVPVGLEGQGVGSQLVKQVLETIKSSDQQIIIVCPFVASYIQRHPEYLELIFGYHPK